MLPEFVLFRALDSVFRTIVAGSSDVLEPEELLSDEVSA